MNLATKYRPSDLSDITEQKLVVDMVRGMISNGEMEVRNFLFTGPAGTGKTTLARCIANELNKGKGEPIEIDAASNSGVDAMRTLLEQAKSYPVGMDWKIFILDEVHAFSNAAWQAALKVFEEVPARTVFLMATTNPEKIPNTILSRVQRFQLSKISLDGIISRLTYIIDSENSDGADITYTDDAINYIARMANGGMRDAITLLEKAISYSNDITLDTISCALGIPDYDEYFKLLSAHGMKDNESICKIIDSVYNSGTNFFKWMSDFQSFVMNVYKYIYTHDINMTTIPSYYEDKMKSYSSAHSIVCLSLANRVCKLLPELRTTQHEQELTLTYLCVVSKK